MTVARLSQQKLRSLTSQIRDAEWQVQNHQLKVSVRSARLVRKIRRQMTAPASLLLAGGIGFMAGEFTKRPTPGFRGTADKPRAAEPTFLRTALSFMTATYTFYRALPLAWMMRCFRQQGRSKQVSEQRLAPAVAASAAAARYQGGG